MKIEKVIFKFFVQCSNWSILSIMIILLIGCNRHDNRNQLAIYSNKQKINYSFQPIGNVLLHENDSIFIGRMRSFAVFNDGRLSFGDALDNKIKIFSSNGEFINAISRTGKGPGETLQIADHCIDDSGRVWISDMGLFRISVYDINGHFINSWLPIDREKDCVFYTGKIRVVKGRIFICFMKGLKENKLNTVTSLVSAFDLEKKAYADYGHYENIVEEYGFPIVSNVFAVDSLNNLFNNHDHSDIVQKYSPGGQLLQRFEFPMPEYMPTKKPYPEGTKKEVDEWNVSHTMTGMKMEIVGKYLFLGFTNTDPKYVENKDITYRHHFLQIFDLDGNCLVDYQPVPGEFLGMGIDGTLYFRDSDEPGKTIISKYKFIVLG